MPEPAAPLDSDGPILLFDGVCGLCHRTVRFILAHERSSAMRFAAIQSDVGRRLLTQRGLDPAALNTVIVVDGEQTHVKSSAVLVTAPLLKRPWSWIAALRVVPQPVRDALYDAVAANRYRIFGRLDACSLPSEAHAPRFLDQ